MRPFIVKQLDWLRQRMDARATDLFDFLSPRNEKLFGSARADYGVLPCGWLPLDVDTFAMDNGGTAGSA